ncbi:MAG: hypothetical protein DRI84_06400 [Bacteroidetes bacterium]|nr:MAG: hypothetical protein DRI84_06400 [Bacteroidota bacterium]
MTDAEITDELLQAEFLIYKVELEEAARIQEIEDHAAAIVAYGEATFVHVEKLVLDYTDMTSSEINNARLSLEHEEASIIEQIRFDALTARFDALSDLRACMIKAGNHTPNSKKMRFIAIRDNDVALLESLEAVAYEVTNDILARENKENEKAARKNSFKKKDKNKVTLKELVELVHDLY